MRTPLVAASAVSFAASIAVGQVYDFTLNSATSGIAGSADFGVDTNGTLVGNYDAATNPTGTRTKPGLFGSFGETENIPAMTTLGLGIAGPISARAAGGFRMGLEADGGVITLSNYAVNLLHSGTIALPATLAISFESFRTRNPTSTYIGGFPLNIPIGDASITRLDAAQIAPAQGTFTPVGSGIFDFSVTLLANVTAEVSILGNAIALPPLPVPITLEGQIMLSGTTAELMSVQPLGFSNTVKPGVMLPQFPLDLPTVLPPGSTASVLFDLALSSLNTTLDTTLTTKATGVLVPSPCALAVPGVSVLAAFRRRRR
ncbi:MAG: hypothetical protein ACKVW3_17035 [Phycisphaerales bacterium]